MTSKSIGIAAIATLVLTVVPALAQEFSHNDGTTQILIWRDGIQSSQGPIWKLTVVEFLPQLMPGFDFTDNQPYDATLRHMHLDCKTGATETIIITFLADTEREALTTFLNGTERGTLTGARMLASMLGGRAIAPDSEHGQQLKKFFCR